MFASLPQQTIALTVLATTAAPGQANSSPLRFWGCLFSPDSAKWVVLERGIKIANAEGGISAAQTGFVPQCPGCR